MSNFFGEDLKNNGRDYLPRRWQFLDNKYGSFYIGNPRTTII